jgi:hypothetical protein
MRRTLGRCALLTSLSLAACAREDAVAVEARPCSSDTCTNAAADGGRLASDAGNDDAGVAADGGAALPPLPQYTLVVDEPREGTTVSGSVTIRGRSAGFLNVEVWDATHQKPPLARATPNTDRTFTLTLDSSTLPLGPVTWTVWGWDSPAGQSYAHTASVTLHLTLKAAPGAS